MIYYDPFDPDPIETQDWTAVDRHLRLPDNVRLMRIAKAIDENHKGQKDATAKWRTEKNRYVGLFGERQFARIFELPMDLALKKYGNQRRNFALSDGTVVDVVTRTWEAGLSGGPMPELTIRHKERPRGKVLVLVYYQGEHLEPVIIGHITEKEAHEVGRVESFPGREIENIVVAPYDLHSSVELLIAHKPNSPWIRAHSERQVEKQRKRDAAQEPEPTVEPAQPTLF